MKRILSFAVLALVLFAAACKKEEKEDTSLTSTNSWKLGSNNFTTVFTSKISVNSMVALTAMDAIPTSSNPTVNTCIVYFAATPTVSGTYRVVSYPGSLTGMQAGVVAGGPAGTYASTGAGTIDLNVTVANGKIQVSIPELPVKKTNATEELKISGNIAEM